MGKLIVIEHLTLDGVMQAPGDSEEDQRDGFQYGGWSNERHDPAMEDVMGSFMTDEWALLSGRMTYEHFVKYWPKQEPNPFSEALENVQKYVVSTTLSEPLEWQNSTLLKGDPIEEVSRLKKELEENLVVFGSGVLVRSLLPHHLIDTFVLLVHPILLGSGHRLFPDSGAHLTTYRLVETDPTKTGVIITTYEADRD